jgi:hypothetical protein
VRDIAGAHRTRLWAITMCPYHRPIKCYCDEQGVCLAERINPFPTKSDIPNINHDRGNALRRERIYAFRAFMRSDTWQSCFHDHIILMVKNRCFVQCI